jgi:hypothetical protein
VSHFTHKFQRNEQNKKQKPSIHLSAPSAFDEVGGLGVTMGQGPKNIDKKAVVGNSVGRESEVRINEPAAISNKKGHCVDEEKILLKERSGMGVKCVDERHRQL